MGCGQGQDSQCSGKGAAEPIMSQAVLKDCITGIGTLITMDAVLETAVLFSRALDIVYRAFRLGMQLKPPSYNPRVITLGYNYFNFGRES